MEYVIAIRGPVHTLLNDTILYRIVSQKPAYENLGAEDLWFIFLPKQY